MELGQGLISGNELQDVLDFAEQSGIRVKYLPLIYSHRRMREALRLIAAVCIGGNNAYSYERAVRESK
jgi:hypothetical protein